MFQVQGGTPHPHRQIWYVDYLGLEAELRKEKHTVEFPLSWRVQNNQVVENFDYIPPMIGDSSFDELFLLNFHRVVVISIESGVSLSIEWYNTLWPREM